MHNNSSESLTNMSGYSSKCSKSQTVPVKVYN